MKVTIFFHSAVDVITNSSTELFCEVTSEQYLPFIRENLEEFFGRTIRIIPADEEEALFYPDCTRCIQFEVEYIEDNRITNDFCKLLDAYLTNLVGKGNFKIDQDVCY